MGKTLHIIGNGFDVMHGLPTRYQDFRNWLGTSAIRPSEIQDLEEAFHHDDFNLWKDLETCLGSLNTASYASHIYQSFDELGLKNQSIQTQQWMQRVFIPDCNHLLQLFRVWAKTIDTKSALALGDKLLECGFDKEGLFITFNYTNTLETIYGIPSNHIFHMHGDAHDDNSTIIVGHGTDYSSQLPNVKGILTYQSCFVADTLAEYITQSLNHYLKPILKNLLLAGAFLKDFEPDNIVVIGCSYGEIDKPYFLGLADLFHHAHWLLNWYSKEDYENAKKYIQELRLSADENHIE